MHGANKMQGQASTIIVVENKIIMTATVVAFLWTNFFSNFQVTLLGSSWNAVKSVGFAICFQSDVFFNVTWKGMKPPLEQFTKLQKVKKA